MVPWHKAFLNGTVGNSAMMWVMKRSTDNTKYQSLEAAGATQPAVKPRKASPQVCSLVLDIALSGLLSHRGWCEVTRVWCEGG